MKHLIAPIVTMLDYTGNGFSDPLWAAKKLIYTKLTRLEQGEDTWNKIYNMSISDVQEQLQYVRDSVRSSWEFVNFTFQIKDVTRGFTHQLVRTRTASFAQQSQRVVNMSNFDYGAGPVISNNENMLAEYSVCMDQIDDCYSRLVDMGAPEQDARGVLPTAVSTSIIVDLNLRTLADLTGKRDNPRAEGEYHKTFKEMVKCAVGVMPWIQDFLYPPRSQTPAIDQILTQMRGDRSPVEQKLLNDAMKEIDRLKSIWG